MKLNCSVKWRWDHFYHASHQKRNILVRDFLLFHFFYSTLTSLHVEQLRQGRSPWSYFETNLLSLLCAGGYKPIFISTVYVLFPSPQVTLIMLLNHFALRVSLICSLSDSGVQGHSASVIAKCTPIPVKLIPSLFRNFHEKCICIHI